MNKALVLGGLLLAATVHAGSKGYYPVVIDKALQSARGSLGSARNSDDTDQFIGCAIRSETSGRHEVTCVAQDDSGNTASCTTDNRDLVDAAGSISGDSHIQFFWDKDSYCTMLIVGNYSFHEPKR